MARVSSEPPAQEKPEPAAAAEPPVPEPTIATSGADVPTSAEDVWRAEYESHVEEWRARSAEQREKAEVEREKWEAVRAQEEREAKARAKELSESVTSGWESVRPDTEAGASPSPADARDLVAGEQQGHGQAGPSTTSSSPPAQGQEHSRPGSEPESSKHDKWEDIPSEMTSSFPSMEFPSDPHSPVSTHQHQHLQHTHEHHGHTAHHGHEHAHHPHRAGEHTKRTATAVIFDSGLSTKTRVLAVLASLAINMLLPFVNGVMLGFGEIFAKEVVIGWFGWKKPGSAAANVGVRARGRKLS